LLRHDRKKEEERLGSERGVRKGRNSAGSGRGGIHLAVKVCGARSGEKSEERDANTESLYRGKLIPFGYRRWWKEQNAFDLMTRREKIKKERVERQKRKYSMAWKTSILRQRGEKTRVGENAF